MSKDNAGVLLSLSSSLLEGHPEVGNQVVRLMVLHEGQEVVKWPVEMM